MRCSAALRCTATSSKISVRCVSPFLSSVEISCPPWQTQSAGLRKKGRRRGAQVTAAWSARWVSITKSCQVRRYHAALKAKGAVPGQHVLRPGVGAMEGCPPGRHHLGRAQDPLRASPGSAWAAFMAGMGRAWGGGGGGLGSLLPCAVWQRHPHRWRVWIPVARPHALASSSHHGPRIRWTDDL